MYVLIITNRMVKHRRMGRAVMLYKCPVCTEKEHISK